MAVCGALSPVRREKRAVTAIITIHRSTIIDSAAMRNSEDDMTARVMDETQNRAVNR